tara:strand:- start:16324 stop:16620 length:297 start_codon:yes stop_codon:yes gene_type:complete
MKKHDRIKKHIIEKNLNKELEEYMSYWYDNVYDDDDYNYDCDCDCDDCMSYYNNRMDYRGHDGLDWYYENREVLERNNIINEILGETGEGSSFVALNF